MVKTAFVDPAYLFMTCVFLSRDWLLLEGAVLLCNFKLQPTLRMHLRNHVTVIERACTAAAPGLSCIWHTCRQPLLEAVG